MNGKAHGWEGLLQESILGLGWGEPRQLNTQGWLWSQRFPSNWS